MRSDPAAKLFGSKTRIKLLRLFLFNPETAFDAESAAGRTKSPLREVARETAMLLRAGVVRRKSVSKEIERRVREKLMTKRKRVPGAVLSGDFPYTLLLKRLLLGSAITDRELLGRIKKAGRMKLIVLSGLFLGEWDGRLDVLVVGDKIKMRRLDATLRRIEAELGRELRYVVFSTADFNYRSGINDRLVRDVFDYPHRTLLDRLHINH